MRTIIAFFILLLSSPAGASELGSISFYGDSFVYRSAWDCGGSLSNEACDALKADSSFVTHVAYPYSSTTTPVFDIVTVDGIGGSTCLPRPGDPRLISRLSDSGENRIAVLIGINDLNLAGRSIADTVGCITAAWGIIADQYDAFPVAITYPPINSSTSVWSGIGGQAAADNRAALNNAIFSAANSFNASRLPGQKLVTVASFSNPYSPNPAYGYTSDGVHTTPQGALMLARYFYWAFH